MQLTIIKGRILMNIIVWNENRHEQKNPVVAEIYPEGIHGAIADFLKEDQTCKNSNTR